MDKKNGSKTVWDITSLNLGDEKELEKTVFIDEPLSLSSAFLMHLHLLHTEAEGPTLCAFESISSKPFIILRIIDGMCEVGSITRSTGPKEARNRRLNSQCATF